MPGNLLLLALCTYTVHINVLHFLMPCFFHLNTFARRPYARLWYRSNRYLQYVEYEGRYIELRIDKRASSCTGDLGQYTSSFLPHVLDNS